MGIDLRVAVLGLGGVGGLAAGLLARSGATVTVLAGADTAIAANRQGVHVQSGMFGDFTAPVRTTERLTERVDVCLVAVKATQLETALARLPVGVLGDDLLVPLLNGTEHVAFLRDRYPDAGVIAAAVRVESTKIAPAQVLHVSPFAALDLAVGNNSVASVHRLATALRQAGLDVQVTSDEAATLWKKLNIVAPMALLTTHEGAAIGVVRDLRRDDLTTLVAEVAAVARSEGALVDVQAVMRFIDRAPAGMQSSMQRDAAAGRPIELEAIGGAVERAAARHAIQVPMTSRLVEELRTRHTPGI